MKGERITNPFRIIELVEEHKAIWCDWTTNGYRLPAAVIVNWQFYLVMKAINEGVLYEYIIKKKVPFHKSVKQYPLTPRESFKKPLGYDEENE